MSLVYSAFCSYIYLSAARRGLDIDELEEVPFIDVNSVEVPDDFLPGHPQVGVTFPNNTSEDVQEAARRFGLSREIVNKRAYYRGSLSIEQASQLLSLSGEVDSYLPYGVASIAGLFAYHQARRLMYLLARAIPSKFKDDDSLSQFGRVVGKTFVATKPPGRSYFPVTQLAATYDAKRHGICCPYYEGMALPDKNFLPQILQKLGLFRLLGGNQDSVAKAIMTFRKGWRSACYTGPGMLLSHAFQAYSLGIDSRLRPTILTTSSGDYLGCVLSGSATLYKGAAKVQIKDREELDSEIHNLDTHIRGIKKLCGIFSTIDPTTTYEESYFNTPRRIHNIIRKLKIGPEERKEIMVCLDLVLFPQTFWNPKDPRNLMTTMQQVASREYPADTEPIPYRSDVMFSHNHVQSILSVYGEQVPSFSHPSGGMTVPILPNEKRSNKDGTLYNATLKKVGISSLPLFLQGYQQATQSWENISKNHFLAIKAKAGRPEGAHHSFPVGRKETDELLVTLGKVFAKTPGGGKKKRVREEKTEDVDMESAKRLMKKLKLQTEDADLLRRMLGISEVAGPSSLQQGAEDEEDEEQMDL